MSVFVQLPALEGGAGGGCQPRNGSSISLGADTHPYPSLKGGESLLIPARRRGK